MRIPQNIVLIPTARHVDQEMQVEVGKIPPILIPINGKPVLDLIIQKYNQLPGNTHFFLLGEEGIEEINQYLKKICNLQNINLLTIESSKHLGDSICQGLEQINVNEFDNLYINFGDTLIDAELQSQTDTIYYDEIQESYRWTSFKQTNSSIEIIDKFQSDHTQNCSVFSGVFLFKSADQFKKCISRAIRTDSEATFYSAMLEYLKDRSYELIKVTEWIDFGHVDNYFSAKRKFINKRFFNQIIIDEHRAVLEKRSSHIEKFSGEVKWYLNLPSALKCYTPQVFDYSLNGESSFIKLEYYGYPPLSDLYLVGAHSMSVWKNVFDSVFRVVHEMQQYQLKVDTKTISKNLKEIYIHKTIDRLNQLRDHSILSNLVQNSTNINGIDYPPLTDLINKLPQVVEKLLIKPLKSLSIIHGDLCLSNMLYDPKSRIIKIIDPRGEFGEYTTYGDFRYDLAKLYHSFHGHFELIISDSFFTICEGHKINYTIFTSDKQKSLDSIFIERLKADFSEHVLSIKLIEALLFISMVPLHDDFLNRQIIMLSLGIEKLQNIYKTIDN